MHDPPSTPSTPSAPSNRDRSALLLWVGGAAAGALVFACSTACTSRPERPAGIIFMSIDALRADHLNCYGYEARPVSPAIDALARDGILFEQAIAASPWTTPSHMTMWTSRSPTEHQVLAIAQEINNALKLGGGHPILSPSIPTLPETLSKAGWSTAAFTGGRTVDPRLGFGRGIDRYDVSMDKLNPRKIDNVLRWIEAQDGPFFLFWHTFEVHAPYVRGRFLEDVVPPENAAAMRRDLLRMIRKPGRKRLGPGIALLDRHGAYSPQVCTVLYDGGIRWVDDAVARMVERLRARRLYDRMMIVITSDHGEQLGERDGQFYNAHGHTLYEEQVHVPLIVKLPGQRYAGRRVPGVVRHLDLMPTILDVARVEGPAAMRGVSLRAFWEGEGPRLEALSEAINGPYEKKALRTSRHKYIVSMTEQQVVEHDRAVVPEDPERRELYDLAIDPRELADQLVAETRDAQALAEAMDARLRRATGVRGEAALAAPDEDLVEGLRELGYIE